MAGQPAVSVLLPVRDADPYLETCLRSLARQTLTDFEVVAVDDGSRDGSGARLEAWAQRDSRFRLLRRPAAGLVPTLNAGLAACRAPYVARLDADDAMPRRRLAMQRQALDADPDLDVVSCLVRHFPRYRVATGFRIYESWLNSLRSHEDILRERFIESPLPHPSVMMRRTVLTAAGGYRDNDWPEDYDLWLRLAAQGAIFAKVPRVLYFWREHPGRLTRTDPRYAVERFLRCKAAHLVAGPLLGYERVILWGAGQTGRRLAKHLQRHGAPLTACLDIDRRKIGRTLRGIPIHDAADLPSLWRQPGRAVVLAAVASRGARALIRARLQDMDLHEGEDYWCVA